MGDHGATAALVNNEKQSQPQEQQQQQKYDEIEFSRSYRNMASQSQRPQQQQQQRYARGGGVVGGGSLGDAGYYPFYPQPPPQPQSSSGRYRPSPVVSQQAPETIQVRLRDLIDPDRNRTFVDNLYAQFEANSNKINLIYMHPSVPTLHSSANNNNNSTWTRALTNQVIGDTKLLNDFYLSAYVRRQQQTSIYESHMPILQSSEVFLILLVISLWIISILFCLRRYSLFLCFHKRDVPFYNVNLINEKAEPPSQSQQQQQPPAPQIPPIQSAQQSTSLIALSAPPVAPPQLPPIPSSPPSLHPAPTLFSVGTPSASTNQLNAIITSASHHHYNHHGPAPHPQLVDYPLYPMGAATMGGGGGGHLSSTQALNQSTTAIMSSSQQRLALTAHNSDSPTSIHRQNYYCAHCNNLMTVSKSRDDKEFISISSGNFNKVAGSPVQFKPCSQASWFYKPKGGPSPTENKLSSSYRDFLNSGLYASNSFRNSSSLLAKVNINTNISKPRTIVHHQAYNQSPPHSFVKQKSPSPSRDGSGKHMRHHSPGGAASSSAATTPNEYSRLLNATQKRSLIRHKKHTFNLLSLDEYVLNFYDRLRKNSDASSHGRAPNLTHIHECTNESTDSGGGVVTTAAVGDSSTAANATAAMSSSSQYHYHASAKPKLSHLNESNPANFISLRSGGTDSLNSGLGGGGGIGMISGGGGATVGVTTTLGAAHRRLNVKPTRSYDYCDESFNQLDAADLADLYASSSLQHSQFLLPPYATPPSPESSGGMMGGGAGGGGSSHQQRAINPISSLRRHMFVNSRRSGAQTTIDHLGLNSRGGGGIGIGIGSGGGGGNGGGGGGGAMNNGDSLVSYDGAPPPFMISTSFASASASNEYALAAGRDMVMSTQLHSTSPPTVVRSRSPTTITTTKVEIINEYAIQQQPSCTPEKDPNLLNPSKIPPLVARTLLEMHERAIKSKSDSNIKSARYYSTNQLLQSPSRYKQPTKSGGNNKKKKKPLSLQNSQDKSVVYSVSSGQQKQQQQQHSTGSTRVPSRSYLNSFYDELKQKLSLFPSSSNTAATAIDMSNLASSSAGAGSGGSGGGSNATATTSKAAATGVVSTIQSSTSGATTAANTIAAGLSTSNTVSTNVSASVTQPSCHQSADDSVENTGASSEKILSI